MKEFSALVDDNGEISKTDLIVHTKASKFWKPYMESKSKHGGLISKVRSSTNILGSMHVIYEFIARKLFASSQVKWYAVHNKRIQLLHCVDVKQFIIKWFKYNIMCWCHHTLCHHNSSNSRLRLWTRRTSPRRQRPHLNCLIRTGMDISQERNSQRYSYSYSDEVH